MYLFFGTYIHLKLAKIQDAIDIFEIFKQTKFKGFFKKGKAKNETIAYQNKLKVGVNLNCSCKEIHTVDTVQDFLIKLGIKPHMHL